MRNIVPFWETCRGNVSQNETLQPTGVHNTLLSVKLPRSSYQCGTVSHSRSPRKEPHIDLSLSGIFTEHRLLVRNFVCNLRDDCGKDAGKIDAAAENHYGSLLPASLPHRKLLVRNFVCNLRDHCGKDAGKIDAAAPGRTQISSRYTIVHPTTVIEVEIFDQK
ncbi:hypothetical protein TVAGG3_0798440 [Trichomonas vaginalis G3]|uniref:hypothetical protein n=1 Tax=Trichomonas vaginalis (strain ATCC PRA-98 / G3) TaxID=412133 RepID=UPI0021E6189E|nr:hypothetical protein TVAGG3_0798440 [Trichomonas vaginalis G3]KAI5496328.1 hypothetical protein TVAGG3_0798440 [Trichomonas vaginalis G3]